MFYESAMLGNKEGSRIKLECGGYEVTELNVKYN